MRRETPQRLARALAVVVAAAISACGGGSDTPQAPSSTQVLLKDGDTLPDGFLIDTIEAANIANDGTIGFIVSRPAPLENAVYLRTGAGDIVPVLTPATPLPDGLSLATVRNLLVSATGDVTFELGSRLDDDAVFLYSGGRLTLVARTDPGSTPPGFRILGERRIGSGGQIAFSFGVSPCTVDASGDRERITCALKVYHGNADLVSELAVPAELASNTPTAVTVIMDDVGHLVLGLPAGGRRSLVGTVNGGVYQSLISRQDVIPGLGTILSAVPRAVNGPGAIVIDARFDTDGDGSTDKDWVIVYDNGNIVPVAETGVPAGTKQVLQVRGNAIDDFGRVTFTVTFGDPGQATGDQSLRIWEGGATQEIAFEGQGFGEDDEGNDTRILDLDQLRVAANGDVVFRGTIGFFEDGTRNVTETRIFRWENGVGGSGTTLLTTGEAVSAGTLVELNVADVSDFGDVLVIAGVNRRSDRALLLFPR